MKKKRKNGRTLRRTAQYRSARARARRVRVRVVHSGPARRRVGNDGWMVEAAATALIRPSPAAVHQARIPTFIHKTTTTTTITTHRRRCRHRYRPVRKLWYMPHARGVRLPPSPPPPTPLYRYGFRACCVLYFTARDDKIPNTINIFI